jgi:hypothetical protein
MPLGEKRGADSRKESALLIPASLQTISRSPSGGKYREGDFPTMHERSYIAEAMAHGRTRQSWNPRLEHWEKPASDSEEAIIQRAATMVRETMAQNRWFTAEGIQISAQGSYFNNTNVRRESDMDLRAAHPDIYVQYAPGVISQYAYAALGYRSTVKNCTETSNLMRAEVGRQLADRFGTVHVDASGNKAVRLTGLAGSRADVDVVPCLVCHYVLWDQMAGVYRTIEGVAIFGRNGTITYNFPEQHNLNGITKRERTRHRFKKNVRMLKRLRDEMAEAGIINGGEVPSFLVECLVYRVEDEHFLMEQDDRYDRLRRIVERMRAQLNVPDWSSAALEINDVKVLFGPHQPWSLETAKMFAHAAWARLVA